MGRGRVELRRIENKISRQVTFSKRRSGLWKKAKEISILCDAEVALVVFSTKGKLFEYSSESRMETVLERYEQHSSSKKNVGTDYEPKENLPLDYPKLVARSELLQRNIRNYGGEDLDPLSLRELQGLEHQLDNALKRIRTRKNQVMHDSISQLHKMERSLQDQNKLLQKQLKEKEKLQVEMGVEEEGSTLNISTIRLPHPTLTIGGGDCVRSQTRNEEDGYQTPPTGVNTPIPPWLLGHVKR